MVDKALEIAQGMETADHDMKTMKNTVSVTPTVLNVSAKTHSAKKPSYRCDRNNHNEKECHFKEVKCHKCGKQGHIATVCRSGTKKTNSQGPKRRHNTGNTK